MTNVICRTSNLGYRMRVAVPNRIGRGRFSRDKNTMSVINIIVADSHPVVVSGINEFLKSASDIRVVATYSDGVQALQAIRDLQPAVAVIALSLPKISGLDVLATVNREQLATRILFYAAQANPRDIIAAMAEGAYGFLGKDSQPHELLHSIREIAAGRKCLPFELLAHAHQSRSPAPIPIEKLLTQREWKVMQLAAQGLSNKEIGRRLGMSAGTAKIHLYHIFQKVGVKSRSALATIAFHSSSSDVRRPNRSSVG